MQTESVGMRLQVSRVTERTTDATMVRGPWTADGKVDLSVRWLCSRISYAC